MQPCMTSRSACTPFICLESGILETPASVPQTQIFRSLYRRCTAGMIMPAACRHQCIAHALANLVGAYIRGVECQHDVHAHGHARASVCLHAHVRFYGQLNRAQGQP